MGSHVLHLDSISMTFEHWPPPTDFVDVLIHELYHCAERALLDTGVTIPAYEVWLRDRVERGVPPLPPEPPPVPHVRHRIYDVFGEFDGWDDGSY